METDFTETQSGRGRIATAVAASAAAVAFCLLALAVGPADAATPQQRYDRAQEKLAEISGSVDQLREQVAADNRRVDALIAELSPVRARADALEAELAAKQAELDAIEADLARERAHLKEVRARLQRALGVLRDQLVYLYMAGTPEVSDIVLGSSNWADLVSRSDYAESIQDHDEQIIDRVTALRDQITAMVERMEEQEARLREARDEIAVKEKAAARARDTLEARRAEFLAARDTRKARIAALQERAGTIEGNLPDLSVDPASSSAAQSGAPAPAPVPGQTAVLGADGLAAAPAGAPQAVKDVIAAANAIVGRPYLWGGGHGSFESPGYDCSGAVSYALHGGGLISSPLDSTGLTTWGEPGEGNWITVYGNSGHAYAVIAGLAWDTSGTGGTGPKWQTAIRDSSGFIARHPSGL
jgi:cell wall-associated NlpC family hydrolase